MNSAAETSTQEIAANFIDAEEEKGEGNGSRRAAKGKVSDSNSTHHHATFTVTREFTLCFHEGAEPRVGAYT